MKKAQSLGSNENQKPLFAMLYFISMISFCFSIVKQYILTLLIERQKVMLIKPNFRSFTFYSLICNLLIYFLQFFIYKENINYYECTEIKFII